MRAINVDGTKHVLAACREQKARLIYMSSIHALTEVKPGQELLEDAGFDETKAYGAYGRSKAEASRLVQAAARAGEVNATLLLPVGCTGPSRLSRVTTRATPSTASASTRWCWRRAWWAPPR